jgi:transposase-like protein
MAATEAELIPPSGLPARYRDYDPRFKAAALVLLQTNNGKLRTTARQLNIPVATLRRWKNGEGLSDETVALHAIVKGEIAEEFELTARMFLARAQDPAAIAQTSAYYAQIAASDAYKSSQLARGLPTSISSNVMSDDERRLKVAELLSRIAERRQTPESDPE